MKLTKNPDGRATMGGSSGGSCALEMAWYHPEWYHRVLTFSGTYVNQQWPPNASTPHGAWGFHETLIPGSPAKPLRIWMEVGDKDNLNPTMPDGMHDWVVANERMAKVLAAKGITTSSCSRGTRGIRIGRCGRRCCRRRLSMCGRGTRPGEPWVGPPRS